MSDTTIRVKSETYAAIIKTRGAFEQTFGMKLTLDDAMFLATSYISIVYELFQTLAREKLIEIVTEKNGSISVKWASLEQIAIESLPRIMTAFENFKAILKEKEQKILPYVNVGT
jgi:thiamine kinase-like enzyme